MVKPEFVEFEELGGERVHVRTSSVIVVGHVKDKETNAHILSASACHVGNGLPPLVIKGQPKEVVFLLGKQDFVELEELSGGRVYVRAAAVRVAARVTDTQTQAHILGASALYVGHELPVLLIKGRPGEIVSAIEATGRLVL